MQTITTQTSDLQPGDIVRTHGLRVLIGQRLHHPQPNVISFQGTIQNPDYLKTDQGRYLFGGIIPLDGSDLRWTIQGTDYVRWAREATTMAERQA